MNNAVCGTTTEKLRNRIDVKLVNNEEFRKEIETKLYVTKNI